MTERSLQVTYRKGRPLAAYLYLDRPTGQKATRSRPSPDGLLVVDLDSDGRALGVEITDPKAVTLERLNRLLEDLGEPALAEEEFRPVLAA